MVTPRARAFIVALVAFLALVLVYSMEQGLRAHSRLRTALLQGARGGLASALPHLSPIVREGTDLAWGRAAALAIESEVATEFEVFDPAGGLLFARPTASPVKHWLDPVQREKLRREQVLTLGPFSGGGGRFLSYLSFQQDLRPVVVRLSLAAPAVAADLGDYRKVMLGHGLGLVALVVLAALVLVPPARSDPARQGALDAYEEVVHQLQARGQSLSRQHEAERDRLERAVQERAAMARAGELTAGIVHEVRNGLATIVGHARLLAPVPDAREAAATILQECETLETVVRRFLDFIREETLQRNPFDLRRFLARVVGREARPHPRCEVSLPDGDLGSLTGDEDLLERAFENLVRNALEAAGPGGHVRLTVSRGSGCVRIFIEDDGPGLDPSVGPRPRAFFSTKAGGTGLGVPIAEKIVLLHSGVLRLDPVRPRGVRAWVELPDDTAATESGVTNGNSPDGPR